MYFPSQTSANPTETQAQMIQLVMSYFAALGYNNIPIYHCLSGGTRNAVGFTAPSKICQNLTSLLEKANWHCPQGPLSNTLQFNIKAKSDDSDVPWEVKLDASPESLEALTRIIPPTILCINQVCQAFSSIEGLRTGSGGFCRPEAVTFVGLAVTGEKVVLNLTLVDTRVDPDADGGDFENILPKKFPNFELNIQRERKNSVQFKLTVSMSMPLILQLDPSASNASSKRKLQ